MNKRPANAAWQAAHPEKYKAYNARWREKNKEKLKASKAIYRMENKEKQKIYRETYYINHPERRSVNQHNYRATKKTNGGKLSPDIINTLFNRQKGKCSICKCKLKRTGHHLDHIVPLSGGGKNSDLNVQLTCPPCNLKKNKKDPIQFMQEQGFLL